MLSGRESCQNLSNDSQKYRWGHLNPEQRSLCNVKSRDVKD